MVKDLAIELENTIAVGDGANDLDMINAAGIGIAWRAKPFVQKNVFFALNSFYYLFFSRLAVLTAHRSKTFATLFTMCQQKTAMFAKV